MIKSRGVILAGDVRGMGEKGHVYQALVGNPEGKRKMEG
jgi:hypothetical protein